MTHHAKRVPWVKVFDTGCLPDSGRVVLGAIWCKNLRNILSGSGENSILLF